MSLLDLSGTPWRYVTQDDLKGALITDDPAWAMVVEALSREEGILLVLAFGGRRLFLQAPERLAFGRLFRDAGANIRWLSGAWWTGDARARLCGR